MRTKSPLFWEKMAYRGYIKIMNDIKGPYKNNFERKGPQVMICHGYERLLYMCAVKSGGGSEMETEAVERQEKDLYKKIYRSDFWDIGTLYCPKIYSM